MVCISTGTQKMKFTHQGLMFQSVDSKRCSEQIYSIGYINRAKHFERRSDIHQYLRIIILYFGIGATDIIPRLRNNKSSHDASRVWSVISHTCASQISLRHFFPRAGRAARYDTDCPLRSKNYR